jgi:hypothetical protein
MAVQRREELIQTLADVYIHHDESPLGIVPNAEDRRMIHQGIRDYVERNPDQGLGAMYERAYNFAQNQMDAGGNALTPRNRQDDLSPYTQEDQPRTGDGRRLKGKGSVLDFFRRGATAVSDAVGKVKEFFSPNLSSYNNATNRALVAYGNKPIESLSIYRKPITEFFNTILNTVSAGKWSQLRRKYGFDAMFHLSLVAKVRDVNDLICIEKLDRVSVSKDLSEGEGLEIFPIPLHGKQFTIFEMLEKARAEVGDKKFFEYDAFRNNCQWFISYLLKGQGLYGEREKEFVFQDISSIVAELPSYVTDFQRGVTDITATFNKITGGRKRHGAGMSGGNITGLQMVQHMQRMLRDLQTVTVVPNHVLARLFNITVGYESGEIGVDEVRDFYRQFIPMHRFFFPPIGGALPARQAAEIQAAARERAERLEVNDIFESMVNYFQGAIQNGFVDRDSEMEEVLGTIQTLIDADNMPLDLMRQTYEHFRVLMQEGLEAQGMLGRGMSGGAYEPQGMMLPFSSSKGYHQYGFGINIPEKEFVEEHRHLVKLLNKSSIPALRREAHKQGEELKMRGGADVRIQPEHRILYPSPLNPRKVDIRDTMKPLRL